MRNNTTIETYQDGIIIFLHIIRKSNTVDLLTKEDRNISDFKLIHYIIMIIEEYFIVKTFRFMK